MNIDKLNPIENINLEQQHVEEVYLRLSDLFYAALVEDEYSRDAVVLFFRRRNVDCVYVVISGERKEKAQ